MTTNNISGKITSMTNTIITTAMLTILLLPVIMIGVADAKRHPWGK